MYGYFRTCTEMLTAEQEPDGDGMATPKRKTRVERQEEGRARVLDAARELFAADGVSGLSVRAIAARAGMPAMTLYGYFPHKTAILRALWSDALAPLQAQIAAAEKAESNAKKRLHRVAQASVDYWLKHPDRYRIVFLTEDRREGEGEKWYIEESGLAPAIARFGPMIADARGRPGSDCGREGEALLCALNGVAHMLIMLSEYRWANSKTYVDLLVRGFY
jgi:AcrR family transcriptional regulator